MHHTTLSISIHVHVLHMHLMHTYLIEKRELLLLVIQNIRGKLFWWNKGEVLKKLSNDHNTLMIRNVVATLGHDRHRLVIVDYLTILYSSSLCMLVGQWSSHVESTILMSSITSWFLLSKERQLQLLIKYMVHWKIFCIGRLIYWWKFLWIK